VTGTPQTPRLQLAEHDCANAVLCTVPSTRSICSFGEDLAY
jgi:hypothetical protein